MQTITGMGAGTGIAVGPILRITAPKELDKVKGGEILVTHMTSPDYVSVFSQLSGIVTEIGAITCHAALIAREMDKPCVVGAGPAIFDLEDGTPVRIDGEKGTVEVLPT
jgi:pyruvate,water dikinase